MHTPTLSIAPSRSGQYRDLLDATRALGLGGDLGTDGSARRTTTPQALSPGADPRLHEAAGPVAASNRRAEMGEADRHSPAQGLGERHRGLLEQRAIALPTTLTSPGPAIRSCDECCRGHRRERQCTATAQGVAAENKKTAEKRVSARGRAEHPRDL